MSEKVPDTKEIRNGYAELADIMGPHPGMALFTRFSSLAARNLLYMQAELLYLRQKLQTLDALDRQQGRTFHKSALDFIESAGKGRDESQQWRIMIKVREKLKEYRQLFLFKNRN